MARSWRLPARFSLPVAALLGLAATTLLAAPSVAASVAWHKRVARALTGSGEAAVRFENGEGGKPSKAALPVSSPPSEAVTGDSAWPTSKPAPSTISTAAQSDPSGGSSSWIGPPVPVIGAAVHLTPCYTTAFGILICPKTTTPSTSAETTTPSTSAGPEPPPEPPPESISTVPAPVTRRSQSKTLAPATSTYAVLIVVFAIAMVAMAASKARLGGRRTGAHKREFSESGGPGVIHGNPGTELELGLTAEWNS